MNILIAASVGAALPWMFTLIWSFIYWDFRLNRRDIFRDSRASVVFAVLTVIWISAIGGMQ